MKGWVEGEGEECAGVEGEGMCGSAGSGGV